MSLTFIPNSSPSYMALSTDISGSKISGASYKGGTVYCTDTHVTYVILDDLTLAEIPAISLGSLSSSEDHIGEVGGKLTSGSVEFTNTSGSGTAYSIGDTVSAGSAITTPYEIPNVFRVNGGSGYIVSLAVATDKSGQTPNFRVHFYSGSSATLSGDNSPYKDSYADTQYKLRPFDLPSMSSSTDTSGSCSRAWDTTTIRQPVIARSNSKSLWVGIETLSAFTPAATSEKYTVSVIMDNN